MIIYLKTRDVIPRENPFKPVDPGIFANLVKSIATYGIMEPLHVIKKDGHYELVQGHQRYTAAQQLKIEEIPCIVVENEEEALGAEFDLNIFRRHLTKTEMIEYEQLKRKKASQITHDLIPGLKYLADYLPQKVVNELKFWSEEDQKKFYNALPVKYVEAATEVEQTSREAIKTKLKITETENKLLDMEDEVRKLKKQLEEKDNEIERLKTITNSTTDEFKKVLETEKKKIKEQLKAQIEKEYADKNGDDQTLSKKREELEKKIEEKLKKQYDNEIEKMRQLAAKHSHERAELQNQIDPLNEQIKQLKKDLADLEIEKENRKAEKEYAEENLKRIIAQSKIPATIETIAKELSLVNGKMNILIDTLIRLGNVVHEEKDENKKALEKLKKEIKIFNEKTKTIIDYTTPPIKDYSNKTADTAKTKLISKE